MKESKTKMGIVNELHKSARRNFRRRKTIIMGYAELWQIDLADMQLYTRKNKGYRYILVVIDCYSKYMWTRPLKTKTGPEIAKATKSVIKEANYCVANIQTDEGREFYNKNFAELMKQYGINHYSTYSSKKAAIVGRVIRTLKNYLYKEFSIRGKYIRFDILSRITDMYNNKTHHTIGMEPADVTPTTILSAYNDNKIALKPKFRIGDVVRISKYKGVFDKGYTANYSTELFKVKKINITNPITYHLEDMHGQLIKGGFYEMEMQKTKYPDVHLVEKILQRKGNKVLVKWKGFPSVENSWVKKSDIL